MTLRLLIKPIEAPPHLTRGMAGGVDVITTATHSTPPHCPVP